MKLVDTNVLVHIANTESPFHVGSRRWLEESLSKREPIGFAWLALVGFVRVSMNPKIMKSPLSSNQALVFLDAWLNAPSAHILNPGPRHSEYFSEALLSAQGSPNLTNDAHLAALAREHKATVVTFDTDFGKFPGVRWEQPQR
ncbi:MAG: type II toxin-antitoxin system VapC family toxin [Propionibacteriaceae bacterium]|nr:type II toxin-antitoxin system VapC family toxin [Propionibacteriaceae bacterium]